MNEQESVLTSCFVIWSPDVQFLFLFFFKLINLFIYGCVGFSFLCTGFL